MITEKNVTWTCRSCLQFEKCLRRRIRDDKTCEWFRPDQQYIDTSSDPHNRYEIARYYEHVKEATKIATQCHWRFADYLNSERDWLEMEFPWLKETADDAKLLPDAKSDDKAVEHLV